MVNGIAWTRQEIDLLVQVVEADGCKEELARRLNRTTGAVVAKAGRLCPRSLQVPMEMPRQVARPG